MRAICRRMRCATSARHVVTPPRRWPPAIEPPSHPVPFATLILLPPGRRMQPNCTMLPILESGSVDAVLHVDDELHRYEAGAGTRSCVAQHRRWRRPGPCGRSSAGASACQAGSSEAALDAERRGWKLCGGGIDPRHGHDGSHAQKTSFPARVKHAHTPLFADSARLTSAMLPDHAPFRMVP